MSAALHPDNYATAPGQPHDFPAYRYYHVGASHEELTELRRRHLTLSGDQQVARVKFLASHPNDVVVAELNALRDSGAVGPQSDDRAFAGSEQEVLKRVGDDSSLAAAALSEEKAEDKPRSGLVKKLEEKLLPPEGNADNSTQGAQPIAGLVDSSGVTGGSPRNGA